jgi:hypothetical protein
MARLGRFVAWDAALALVILLLTATLSLSPPAVHDSIRWPFTVRWSWEVAAQVPGGPPRVLIGTQVAFVGMLAMIVLQWLAGARRGGAAPRAQVALPRWRWTPIPPPPALHAHHAVSVAAAPPLSAHCATCHGLRRGRPQRRGAAGRPPI